MKITLIVNDLPEGWVNVKLDFDPPLDDSTPETAAAKLGAGLLDYIKQAGTIKSLAVHE